MKKQFLIFLLFILIFLGLNLKKAKASHIPGANITYTCDPANPLTYIFTLKVYRKCPGILQPALPFPHFELNNTCGLTNPVVPTFIQVGTEQDVNQLCNSVTSICTGGTQPGMWEYTYEGTITFPADCDNWKLDFEFCCRDVSTNISGGGSSNLIGVSTLLNTLTSPCNNSPIANTSPIPYVCAGTNFSYCLGMSDIEGDSLFYSMVTPAGANQTPIPHAPGFSTTNPLSNFSLNSQTGCISFNEPNIGNYVVAIQVNSYDVNGNLISTSIYDFQIIVINCTNLPPTNPVGGITNFNGNGTLINTNTISACLGDFVCFDVVFQDMNPGDSLTITQNGTINFPGATFTQTGSNPVTGTFCWTVQSGQTSNVIIFSAEDNACPIIGNTDFPVSLSIQDGVFAGQDVTICGAQSIQLQASGSVGPFIWSPSTGLSCTNCPNPIANPLTTTTYTLTGSLTGACPNTDQITVNVEPTFPLTVTPIATTICANGSVQLSANGPVGSGPYTYAWSPSVSLNNSTISNPIATPLTTTTYIATVTGINGCTVKDSITIIVSGVGPSIGIISTNTNICEGVSVSLITFTNTTPLSNPIYSWTPTLGLNNPNIINPIATPNTSTTYLVNVTDPLTGCIGSATININVSPNFTLTPTASPSPICNGASTTLSPNPNIGGTYTYSWMPSGVFPNPNATNQTVTPTGTTTYYVTASNGFCNKNDSITVTVQGFPVSVFVSEDTVCQGDIINLAVSATPSTCGINFSGCNGSTSTGFSGVGTSSSALGPFTNSTSKKVQFIFTAAELSAMGFSAGTITELAVDLTVGNIAAEDMFIYMGCSSQTEYATFSFIPTSSLVEVYSNSSYTASAGWNTFNITGYNWDGLSSIVIQFCSNRFSGSTGNGTLRYTTTSPNNRYLWKESSIANPNAPACDELTGTRTPLRPNMRFKVCTNNFPNPITYNWTPTTGLSNPTIQSPSATIGSNITYTVTVTDPANPSCPNSTSISIYVDPTNSVTASNDTVICPGDAVELSSIFNGSPLSIPPSSCGISNGCTQPTSTIVIGNPIANAGATLSPFFGSTNTNTNFSNKVQMIFTPAEMNAMGYFGGTIQDIALDVTSTNGYQYDNVSVWIGCSTQSEYPNAQFIPTISLTQVFGPVNLTAANNTWHIFNITDWDWDGTSNLVIQICAEENSAGNVGNSFVRTSSTFPTNRAVYKHSSTASICNDFFGIQTASRPNVRFTVCDGPPGSLTYNWTPSTSLSNPNISNPVATPTTSTAYVVEVIGGMCTVYDTVNVTILCSSFQVFGDTSICLGDTANLWAIGTPPFSWANNLTPSTIISSDTTITVSPTITTTYLIYGSADTLSITVNVSNPPIINLGNDTTLCQGETLLLDATIPNATYLWQNNSTNPTFNITQQGTYWVEITVNNCTATDTITVNYNPLPIINLGNDSTLCQGETLLLDVTTLNATYLWNDNSTNPTFNITQQGTYWIEITVNNCTATDTIIINYNNSSLNINLGNDTTLCQGETLLLDVTTLNAIYLWNNSSTNPTFNITQQGTYWVDVNISNCVSTSDTIIVNYNPLLTIDLGNDTTLCQGETLLLDVTTLNATYLWNDNSTNPTFNITQQGTYWVEITVNNCIAADTIIINYDNSSLNINLGNDTTLCQGETLLLDVTTLNATYLWNNNSTNPTFNITQQGTYWVNANINNCVSSSDTIVVNYNPLLTIDLGNDTTLCQEETLLLDVTTLNATYLWNDNSDNSTFNATQQGIYWVKITVNGCDATDSITVNYTPTLVIDLGNDTSLCQEEAFLLNATTLNATYLWQDNSTNPTFNITQQGIYWIEITVNNCIIADTIKINYNPLPILNLGADTILCSLESLTLDVTTQNASYLWQDNSTNPIFNITQQGSYSVELSVNGCSITDSITVNYDFPPIVFLGNDTTLCEEETLILDATAPNVTYLWQDNSTNPIFDVFEEGTYWVKIENDCGISSDTIKIKLEDCDNDFQIYIPNSFTPDGDSRNEFFKASGVGIKEFNMLVFSRWGELLFESNTPLIGWSGNFNGEPVPVGIYIYSVRVKFFNNKNVRRTGHINLIR